MRVKPEKAPGIGAPPKGVRHEGTDEALSGSAQSPAACCAGGAPSIV